jgi:predicted nucleotide-binding protein
MNDMNERGECIEQLREFRELLYDWEYGDGDSNTRSEINRRMHAVRKIVERTGTLLLYGIAPPPAIGGMIMKNVNPFNCIFDSPYGLSLNEKLMDIIERAIGVIEADPKFTMEVKQKKLESIGNKKMISNRVFIVHGKDEHLKETTARFLEKIGLKPIVLHEQSNKGKTIIEKFEDYSDVSFAVILMTPDDVGKINDDKENLRARARQNVILELGYFLGKLGRNHVAALVKGDIEIPSDYSGILFTGVDPNGMWKMALAKEIKASGIDIDLNKVL